MGIVDVQLVPGLALPYVEGAESALDDVDLDPSLALAWQTLLAAFPAITLRPLFGLQPVAELADLIAGIRLGGDEPPDPFCWYAIVCDDAVDADLTAALVALPMVASATVRAGVLLASTVAYGTNPDTSQTFQIQPAPTGVDAIHAWQVAGGTGLGAQLADIEVGWNLDHEELRTARIHHPASGAPRDTQPHGGHGTAAIGIMVAADNGVGMVGIVPDADLTLVPDQAVFAAHTVAELAVLAGASSAARVVAAATAVGNGGVVLIEEATNFLFRPPLPNGDPDERPDVLIEFLPGVQAAMLIATQRGVTVIEPAGNGGVNLDGPRALAFTRPGSRTFSFAVVVGEAERTGSTWAATTTSCHGSRVDCFASGRQVRAPSNVASNAYEAFTGTSAAGAIIAGVAGAIQGMSLAATGSPLAPADVRRLLSDPRLGTPAVGGGIGTMPDLRKIARAQGWPRILPAGAAVSADNALVLAMLDDDEHLVVRRWTSFTGWGLPLVLKPPSDGLALTPCQPAVTSTGEAVPEDRLVDDIYVLGPAGVQHLAADSNGDQSDLSTALSPASVPAVAAAAQGRSVAAVRTAVDTVVIAAVGPTGRLAVMTGDPDDPGAAVSDPLVLSTSGMYRRTPGPALASRSTHRADVVAIEDGGGLSWFTGSTDATIGTGWTVVDPDPTMPELSPGARPALLAVGSALLAAAVGIEGWLWVTTLDPDGLAFGPPVVVDASVTVDTAGPVALGVAGLSVVVLGVDTDGVLRAAARAVAGGDWSPLAAVPSAVRLSRLGGVVAVSMPDVGVMAVAVAGDGTVLSALSPDGVLWGPLLPLL